MIRKVEVISSENGRHQVAACFARAEAMFREFGGLLTQELAYWEASPGWAAFAGKYRVGTHQVDQNDIAVDPDVLHGALRACYESRVNGLVFPPEEVLVDTLVRRQVGTALSRPDQGSRDWGLFPQVGSPNLALTSLTSTGPRGLVEVRWGLRRVLAERARRV